MSGRSKRWVKRHLDDNQQERTDRQASAPGADDEMSLRVMHALEASLEAQTVAQAHAQEAQRLFGAIRREIAVTKAKGVRPTS